MRAATKQDQELPPPIEVQELPFFEIRKKTNNFDKNFLIRKGSHAEIYKIILEDKSIVIKKLQKSSKQADNAEFLKQVSIASRLKHENFVELLGYYVNGENRLLAYEFSQIGSLHDILHGARGAEGSKPRIVLTWQQRIRIALESAKGLEYLHVGPCITHKDIRSSSILLFRDFRAKIIDYNLYNQAPEMDSFLNSTMALGTFIYHSPE
ncbi:hypothetical protein LUZ60_004458 [Juncus effusus]|nr:hypothetical protein LUZ60_004458 [Juncus effusus]